VINKIIIGLTLAAGVVGPSYALSTNESVDADISTVVQAAAAEALPRDNPQQSPARNFDVQKLADGVYAVIRKDLPGLMVDANNVFIINDDDVVVVDANGAPSITREVLAALRKLTDKIKMMGNLFASVKRLTDACERRLWIEDRER
jgi:hypothetical protein